MQIPVMLANRVMVKTPNGSWRMCVDFTNFKKCVFGVRSRKFLGFMVSQRGIDAKPKKVISTLELPVSQTKRNI